MELRPVFTLAGDEVYFLDRFRAALLAELPPEGIEYSRFEEDLATTPLDEILDRARNPSLLAPLQVFLVRNAKELFGRGEKKHGKFPENVARFVADTPLPPAAVVVFIADHLHLPADRQRMALEDKTRLGRIQETLGRCGPVIECGRVEEAQAVALTRQMGLELGAEISPESARELVAALDGNLGLIRREVEKLSLYALPERTIGKDAIGALVADARLGSAYELAASLGRGERRRSLAALQRLWLEAGDGGAIGLVFQLSRALQMALVVKQEGARDRSALYRVLPEGMKPPGFAADTILLIARSMAEGRMRRGIQMLHAADVKLRSSPPSAQMVFEEIVLALTKT